MIPTLLSWCVLRHFPMIISTPLNTFNPVKSYPFRAPRLSTSPPSRAGKSYSWKPAVMTLNNPFNIFITSPRSLAFRLSATPNFFYSVKRFRNVWRSLSFPTPFSNRTPRRKCSKTLDSKSNDSSDSRTPWITNQVIPFHLSILTTQPSISLSCGQHSPFLLYNPHPPCWRPVQPQTRQHIKRES